MFIRNPYNYDVQEVSVETGLCCTDVTRTKQQFAEECDINTIVRRFNLTGQLPSDVRAPQYADFEEAIDYHTAMNAIIEANDSFEQMTAEVRSKFNNDPAIFVDFCNDPKNIDAMIEMGLAVAKPVAAPVPVISDPAAPVPKS